MTDKDTTIEDSVNLVEQEQRIRNETQKEIMSVKEYSSKIEASTDDLAQRITEDMESMRDDFKVVSNEIVEKINRGLSEKAKSVLKDVRKELVKLSAITIFVVVGIIIYLVFHLLLHLIDRLGLILVIAFVLLLILLIVPEVSNIMKAFLENYVEQITSFARDTLSPYINENTPHKKAQEARTIRLIKFLNELSTNAINAASVISARFSALLQLREKISQLNVFKEEYKYALKRYSVLSNGINDEINAFNSALLSSRDWVTKLSQHLSNIFFPENFNMATRVFEIMYYDLFDENFKKVLLAKLKDKDLVFFTKIIDKHLSSGEGLDRRDNELLTKILKDLGENFSLSKVTTLFYRIRERFKTDENYFLKATSFFGKVLEDDLLQFYRIECKSIECDDFNFEP